MNNRDYIKSIKDVMLCIQVIVRSRFKKKTKIIFTKGRYKSAYLSFYKDNYTWQFYCEDKVNRYELHLLKNDKVIRSDFIRKGELVDIFYQKLIYFFRYM